MGIFTKQNQPHVHIVQFCYRIFGSHYRSDPPGLLNITAAKISMKQGRKVALLYATGVCITVCLQTYIALIFARYLDRIPKLSIRFCKVALDFYQPVPLLFFLGQGYPTEKPKETNYSTTNRFFMESFWRPSICSLYRIGSTLVLPFLPLDGFLLTIGPSRCGACLRIGYFCHAFHLRPTFRKRKEKKKLD